MKLRRVALAATAIAALVGLATTGLPAPLVAAVESPVKVPSSVDGTGSRDVTSDLVAFFESVPDGSTVQFPHGSRYRIEGSIILENRHDLTIDGTGATFFATTDGTNATEGADHWWWGRNWPRKRGQFILDGGSGYTLKNLTILGGNPLAGKQREAYVPALEAQHGVEFFGTSDSVLEGCEIHGTYGDLVSVSGASENIVIRGCLLTESGRQGITVDEATNVVIENNEVGYTGRSVIDLEPARSDWVVEHVTIRNNLIRPGYGIFLAAYGQGPVNHVLVDNNDLRGEQLKVLVRDGEGKARHHWTITNNTSSSEEGSPEAPLRFRHVDHITIAGNYQKIASTQSRTAVDITDSTTVNIRQNQFPIVNTRKADKPPTGETALIYVNHHEHSQPVALPPATSVPVEDGSSGQTEPVSPPAPVPTTDSTPEAKTGDGLDAPLVRAAVADFLGREPTAEERAKWAHVHDTPAAWRTFVAHLADSSEWVGALVDRLYEDALGRPADAEGRRYWIAQLRTEAQTQASVAASMYGSNEYFKSSGRSLDRWVDDVYRALLRRNPDAAGHAHWQEAASRLGRAYVAAALYDSDELLRRRVDAMYRELLGRPAEPGGLAHWVSVVRQYGSDLPLAVDLASSAEYRRRHAARQS